MTEETSRVEKLLAMLLIRDMHDAPQGDKAIALSRVGFSNSDIAALLGTNRQVINQQLYAARRSTSKSRKK